MSEILLTPEEAAARIGRPGASSTIRYWVKRGWLKASGRDGRAQLYLEDDVLRVERDLFQQRATRRRSGPPQVCR